MRTIKRNVCLSEHWKRLGEKRERKQETTDGNRDLIAPPGLLYIGWNHRERRQSEEILVVSSVGPLGYGSVRQRYGSGSASLYHLGKIVRKTLIPTVLWLLSDFLSYKNDIKYLQMVISRTTWRFRKKDPGRIHLSEARISGSGSVRTKMSRIHNTGGEGKSRVTVTVNSKNIYFQF
jgi:hypothetical protein